MSNLTAPSAKFYFPELASDGVLKTAFEPQMKLQLLDPKEVGAFATEALTSGKWNGEVIPLAGQELTMGEIPDEITHWIRDASRTDRTAGRTPDNSVQHHGVKAEFIVGEEEEKMKILNPMVPAPILA